jgi:16S rRNA (guanine(966)-N(2))-methyltransferase RsmD
VKQALFDALATRVDLNAAPVLDLYAGTGSLGIECLSRGARHCTFVDSSTEAVSCIGANLETLGCTDAADVVHGDAMRFVQACRQTFRLIFADPPYSYPHTADLPDAIFSRGILERSGYLLIEHSKNVIFGEGRQFILATMKKFGSTHVSFFVHSAS